MRFHDRSAAARPLEKLLAPHLHGPVIVYALTSLSIPLAAEIAVRAGVPLDLLLVADIPDPLTEGSVLGAVAESGEHTMGDGWRTHVDGVWFADRIEAAQARLVAERRGIAGMERRRRATGCCALIVDDGVASPMAIRTALDILRGEGATKLVVGLAVGDRAATAKLEPFCAEILALEFAPPGTHPSEYFDEAGPRAPEALQHDFNRARQPSDSMLHRALA